MTFEHVVRALLKRGAVITQRHTAGVVLVLGGCLLPRVCPLTVGRDLYWIAWWTLLVCWVVGRGETTVLSSGGSLSYPDWCPRGAHACPARGYDSCFPGPSVRRSRSQTRHLGNAG